MLVWFSIVKKSNNGYGRMSSLKRVFLSFFVITFLGFTSQVKATDLSWDMDSNGNIDALTDGLLLLRYTFGLRGNDLASGAVSTDSPLSPSAVETRIESMLPIADIDGSGEIDALTDGLIILRYLFDIKDESLISGVVADNANRSSLLEISQHLIDHMPGIHTGGLPNSLIINEAVSSNSSFDEWVAEVDKIKEFTDNRIPFLTNHFLNYFSIGGTHNLTLNINNTEAGSVQLNSLTLSYSSWQGEYFDNIPISIEAIPNEGYVFSHWDGVTGESSAALTISMTADMTIQAVFVAE
jgi:hypothetical protein